MFRLREHGTTVGAEIRGGLVTFLTLSYILFVQPAVLSAVGMPRNDVFVATCVCSALACFLMGILTNYPFALAPAMGHNFFFAFTVCSARGSWMRRAESRRGPLGPFLRCRRNGCGRDCRHEHHYDLR